MNANDIKNELYKNLTVVFIAFFIIYPFTKSEAQNTNETKPNIINIFTDDQGYGDLSSYGAPNIRTTHLDKMASEGQKWTNFYAAASEI